MNFCNLHGHTTFSFLDGMGAPEQIAKRVSELGQKYVAVTDHGNVYAHVPYIKAAKKYDLKIIFGMEAYFVPNIEDRSPVVETRGSGSFPHLTILARTQTGYINLMKLHKLSWEEGYYYKPRIDFKTLFQHQEGLTILSGCVGGLPLTYLRDNQYDKCYEHMTLMKQNIESYYAEFVPTPGKMWNNRLNTWEEIPGALLSRLAQIAYDLQLPSVITSDAHFPTPEDHIHEDIMLCVGTGQKLNDFPRKMQLLPYHYYGTEIDLMQRTIDMNFNVDNVWFEQALSNSVKIAESCDDVEIPKAGKFTYIGFEPGETAESRLWRLVSEGAINRIKQGKIPAGKEKEYHKRASFEYGVLKQKGFCDYVLAVHDIVMNGKNDNELVMLRGSAAGCLLFWLMGTSETDSIFHELSFERFFDMNRNDPPDVDMDFELRKRDRHIKYVFDKYGHENCAQISNISTIKAKQAVTDTAKVLGIPRSEFAPLAAALDSADDEVDKQIDALEDDAAKEVLRMYPQLKLAAGLVGQYRQSGIHAAGVVISPEPLGEKIGVARNKAGRSVVSMDKRGAAALGYLKMDMLSVNNYDVVAQTVRKLGFPVSMLYDLPLNDPNVYTMANAGMLAGVFQLSGGAAHRVSRIIGLDTFEDLYAASALCRPGPSEMVEIYAQNKHNPESFQHYLRQMHPVAGNIVKNTFGVMIYQEQVMRIARELACMEWADVHKLRKGIQDKLGLIPHTGMIWEEEWKNKFINGCMNNHQISLDEVESLWFNIKKYGGYGFNKSHACVYGQIGYWMLWLKTYYPDTFYETYLQYESDNGTRKSLIREYTKRGGKVLLFDPEKPTHHFSCIEHGRIVGGFADLTGIGEITVDKAMEGGRKGEAFINALGSSIAQQIRETGILNNQINPQRLISLASWFPVPATGQKEKLLKDHSITEIKDILKNTGMAFDGDVTTMGYITALDIDEEKIVFVLEDEGGMMLCRVPLKRVSEMKATFDSMRIGDYVAFMGWWSGEVFYLKHGVIMLAAPDVKLENRNRKMVLESEKAKTTAEKALTRWRKYKESPKQKEKEMFERAEIAFMSACDKIKNGLGEEYFDFWLKNMGEPNPYLIDRSVEFNHGG